MSKYRKIKDYDATIVDPEEAPFALACCDCGLVHYIKLEITEDSKVVIAFKSDKRITAQLRRHNYGDLQRGKSSMYRMERRE